MTDRFAITVDAAALARAIDRAAAKLERGKLLGEIGAVMERVFRGDEPRPH